MPHLSYALAVATSLLLVHCAQSVTPLQSQSGNDGGPQPESAGCPFDPGANRGVTVPVLVMNAGPSILTIQSDRTTRTLFTFAVGLGIPDADVVVTDVQSRDGFIAAHALLDATGGV